MGPSVWNPNSRSALSVASCRIEVKRWCALVSSGRSSTAQEGTVLQQRRRLFAGLRVQPTFGPIPFVEGAAASGSALYGLVLVKAAGATVCVVLIGFRCESADAAARAAGAMAHERPGAGEALSAA
jgi:hypothetical protein